ncbi:unnamed protein product, partial [Symbiodinium sp. CCMP2456]
HACLDGRSLGSEGLEAFLEELGMDTVSLLGLSAFDSIVPLTSPEKQAPRRERRREFISHLGTAPKKTHEAEEFAGDLLQKDIIGIGDLRRLSELLPSEVPARGGVVEGTRSFSSGMFVHGGVVGLRRNCRDFPLTNTAVARFVAETYPAQEFTSFAFMTNVKTALHRDSHNHQGSRNLVVKLSSFSKGEVWVSDGGGDVFEEIAGQKVPGRNLSFRDGAVSLDPRRWHLTQDWIGERTVLVLHSVRDFLKAPRRDLATLVDFGFHLPSEVYKKFKSLSLAAGRFLTCPTASSAFSFEFDSEQYVFPKKYKRTRAEALQRPGYLDLYSGSRGVAHALAEKSGTWVLTFDYARSASEDLLDPQLQERIFFLIRNRAFLGGGGGPMSAREAMLPKIDEGNRHAAFTARVVKEFQALRLPVWVENPHGSYFWRTPAWQDILGAALSIAGCLATRVFTVDNGPRRRLDLNACAKCSGARTGEAKNPGPQFKGVKLDSLEDVALVTDTTAKLQSRVLAGFEEWPRG